MSRCQAKAFTGLLVDVVLILESKDPDLWTTQCLIMKLRALFAATRGPAKGKRAGGGGGTKGAQRSERATSSGCQRDVRAI
jgi:hypothetical protein